MNGRLKTQFYTAMQICKTKNYQVPIDYESFEGDDYNQPSRKKLREIDDRLEYSRRIYLEKNPQKVKRLIKIKQNKALIRSKQLSYPKKVLKKLLRVS